MYPLVIKHVNGQCWASISVQIFDRTILLQTKIFKNIWNHRLVQIETCRWWSLRIYIYIYYKRTLDTYIVDYQCFNYTLYKTIMQVFFPLKQHIIELTHPKSLGWRFLKIVFLMILIRFRYDLLLWFVYGLVLLLWFWYGFSYDFDMISVMILDVGQTCDLKPTHRNHIQNIPKSYQNHIKIVSKPYQNRIKIVSKSYQNHKNLRQIDQEPVPVLFLFLF